MVATEQSAQANILRGESRERAPGDERGPGVGRRGKQKAYRKGNDVAGGTRRDSTEGRRGQGRGKHGTQNKKKY